MVSIALISQNTKEQQILKTAFEQYGFKVVLSQPNYQNFVFIMQLIPDIIMIELPHQCLDQLNFTKRIHGYKRTKMLPIIGYGDKTDQGFLKGMQKAGVITYMERPLKFSEILKMIEKLLKPFNKKIEPKKEVSEKEKDIAIIIDKNATPNQKLEAMSRHIAKLQAFPFTIAKVLQITNDENTGAQHLAKAINSDPSIAAHLLKVSNSVFFASANRRISSIKEAIVRIGFRETKKIVMSMSIINLFSKVNKNLGFDRTDFWYHSLATAVIAEKMATSFGDVNTEIAFMAGLLHSLGILLMDEYFPELFSDILQDTAKEAHSFVEESKKKLGISHLDLIGNLFPKWKIPDEITNAIISSEQILSSEQRPTTEGEKLAACVAIGDIVAKLIHCGRECDEFVIPIKNSIFEAAKMVSGITKFFIEDITNRIVSFSNFLGLEKREYHCDCPDIDPNNINIGIANIDQSIFIPPLIDLMSHKIKYEMINLNEKKEEKQYNALICWSLTSPAPETTKNIISTYEEVCPIILFTDPSVNSTSYEKCTILSNRLDLRTFESKLFELFTEKSIKNCVASDGG
ncbi:MAG: HDOD domain-containing protein [Chitinispirillaceae bacterium]|nr:HDOD domain-containing protein [Chitinispirillaceae bacterium]